MKEEFVKKVVKYILERKYPEVLDVMVTTELNMHSYVINRERNYVYNVFIFLENTDLISDSYRWNKLKDLIKTTLKSSGIDNDIRVYAELPEDFY